MGLISRMGSRTYRKKKTDQIFKNMSGYKGTNSQGNSYYKSGSGRSDYAYNNSDGSYYHHANYGGNNYYREASGQAHSQKSGGWQANNDCTHRATNPRGNDYSTYQNNEGAHEYRYHNSGGNSGVKSHYYEKGGESHYTQNKK